MMRYTVWVGVVVFLVLAAALGYSQNKGWIDFRGSNKEVRQVSSAGDSNEKCPSKNDKTALWCV